MSAHFDDCLIACKTLDAMEEFKAGFLAKFAGTHKGEATEYLGSELIRDRKAKIG